MLYKLSLILITLFGGLPIVVYALDDAPRFSMPLACTVGGDCFIQNYVDDDDSANYRDYRCGFLSYDGHRGTDFRPKAAKDSAMGVPVFAAADGKVRAIRDGMDDISVRELGNQAIQGREAGNSVVIVHGNGWESQYAHMKKGSITVRAGQLVLRGTLLGGVGLSGNTEFPHLHFEVRHNGKPVDPFVGISGGDACSLGKYPLWMADALGNIAYIATDVLAAGFTDHPLAGDELIVDSFTLPARSPALVFWLTLLGVQGADMQLIDLFAPDGKLLLHKAIPIERNMAQYRSFVGLKRQGDVWDVGDYRVTYQLLRKQQSNPVVDKQFRLHVN